jgi:sensor histidine kinase YesM
VPPLLIQPIVENAIWHGLLPKVSERRLEIRIWGVNGNIEISIEDNGIGRKAAAQRNEARNRGEKSMGMRLTTDRIALIKTMLNISTQIHLDDLEDTTGRPTGTRVTISIPRLDESAFVKENENPGSLN